MTDVEVKVLKKEVKKYIDNADERMLKAVYAMLEADQQEDLWNNLNENIKAGIDAGLKDIEEGRVTSHKEVWKKYNTWLTK